MVVPVKSSRPKLLSCASLMAVCLVVLVTKDILLFYSGSNILPSVSRSLQSSFNASEGIVSDATVAGGQNCGSDGAYSPVETSTVFEEHAEKGTIFKDLSPDEMTSVKDWMIASGDLSLVDYDSATVDSSYILKVTLEYPKKNNSMNYIERNGPRPVRRARVVVYHGAINPPIVKEYIVGPLPISADTKKSVVVFRDNLRAIPYNARAADGVEYAVFAELIAEVMSSLEEETIDSYGTVYSNSGVCAPYSHCLTYSDTSPLGPSRDRTAWLLLNVASYWCNPVGFTLTFRMDGSDRTKYQLRLITYNGQAFIDVESFKTAYRTGTLKKIASRPLLNKMKASFGGNSWGDMDQKVKPFRPRRINSNLPEPQLQEPGGKRYAVKDNHVEYLGWSFDIAHRYETGAALFNIRYKGVRTIYETTLSEAFTQYSGVNDLAQVSSMYIDTNWGMTNYELVKGVDVPSTATCLDWNFLYGSSTVSTVKNSICIFELNVNTPLRRHMDAVYGFKFYGGMTQTTLVVRSIATSYNYDYIIDYVFHINGAFEIKVSTSGYLQSAFYSAEMDNEVKNFGQRIRDNTAGTLHDHIVNFKIDVDVNGDSEDRLIKTDIIAVSETPRDINGYEYKNRISSFAVATDYKTKKIVKSVVSKEAGFSITPDRPQAFIITDKKAKNRWGAPKGFKMEFSGIIQNIISDQKAMRAFSFTKYTMAVTKRKENEPFCTSVYDQADPTGTIFALNGVPKPFVDLDRFIDGEDIDGQDLVVWANVGVHHIPHAEDIPVTPANTNPVSIRLMPVNYFDFDDSYDVDNMVYITPSDTGSAVVNTYTLQDQSCPLTYDELAADFVLGSAH